MPMVYAKKERSDLTKEQLFFLKKVVEGAFKMNNELLGSIEEAGTIMRDVKIAFRKFNFAEPDVKAIRE